MKLTGRRCHCRACGEYFNSTGAFDQHRYGPMNDRKCRTPEMLGKRGHVRNDAGFWEMRPKGHSGNASD